MKAGAVHQAAAAQCVEQGAIGWGLDVGVQVDALHEQGAVFFEGVEVEAACGLLAFDQPLRMRSVGSITSRRPSNWWNRTGYRA